ncbi:unnamed protein product [Rhizopus stolonifer]
MALKRKCSALINTTEKKSKKISVRFHPDTTILETYSSEEYDRSGIFSSPTLYKINSSRLPTLSLDIPALTLDDSESSSAETSPIPISYPSKKKKPALSINTSLCSDPLFFSNLTTHYKSDSLENDYLSIV